MDGTQWEQRCFSTLDVDCCLYRRLRAHKDALKNDCRFNRIVMLSEISNIRRFVRTLGVYCCERLCDAVALLTDDNKIVIAMAQRAQTIYFYCLIIQLASVDWRCINRSTFRTFRAIGGACGSSVYIYWRKQKLN